MIRVHVLKPFRFSAPGEAERVFNQGDYLLDPTDPLLQSKWVKAGADGCVETLAQSLTRLRALVAHHDTLATHDLEMAKMYQAQVDALLPPPAPVVEPPVEVPAVSVEVPVEEVPVVTKGKSKGNK